MKTTLKRYFEDLNTFEQELLHLRSRVVAELSDTEKHVQGLRKALDDVDHLLHKRSEGVIHDA